MKPFVWIALFLCAWPVAAQEEIAPAAAVQEGVFDRLASLLEAIPERWESIPAPVVPVSGRPVEEVLGAASDEESQEALQWIYRLRSTPLAKRPSLIQAELQRRLPTEVDLWRPGSLAQEQQMESLADAAVTLEAWLQWAEVLGRRDALLYAASFAIYILRFKEGAPAALPLIRTWAALPSVPSTQQSQALIQISLADVLSRLGENQTALEACRKARQLSLAVKDQLGVGYSWDCEAEALVLIGENWKALEAFRNARQLFQAAGDQLGQGNTWRGEADVLFRLGESSRALEAFRNARQQYLAAGDQLGQGNTWRGEAEVLFRLGESQKALEAFRKARELFLVVGDQLGQGQIWDSEAKVLYRLGENQKALGAYRNARQVFLALGDQLGQGNTWNGEAEILSLLGENQKALEAFKNARQLFLSVGSQLGEGNAWNGEANVLFRLGESQRALEAYRNARELFLAVGSQLGQGNTWSGEADVFFHLGESQNALEAYRKARQLFLSVGSQLGQGNTWKGEADVFLLLGESQKSLEAYRKARQLFMAVGSQLGQGNTWLGESRVLRQNLNWAGVRDAAATAIAIYKSSGVVSSQISAFLLKAEAEDRTGNSTAAAQSASEAIRLHSQWRKNWITDRHRTAQEETINAAYDFLIPLWARQAGEAAEALRLAEEARSRVLLDLLATPPGRGESVSAVDLMAERQRLEAEIWQIEEQLGSSPEPDRQAELRAWRRQLDQELEWNRYQRIAAQEESFSEAPPLDAAAIQALAMETGPILLYYAAPQHVWGFLVLPGTNETVLRPIALPWGELGREVRGLAHGLANPLYEPRAEAQARKLWDLLIAPFSDRIPTGGPLVLVPHGPLHELPFEGLLDPAGKPLFERWQISVTPSVSALDFARRRHTAPTPNDSFLAFSSGQGLNLPVAEVAEISGFFGTNKATFRPTEARYQNYEKLVTQARHLLIATRGVHTQGSRSETYLEIQPTPEVHDSRLTAAEIATIPLKAELVTLAACDTSYGQALLSDERLDLTRSFLIARAAAVLATRWKVPEDAATSRFLSDFYRAYRRGGPQGTGMRKDEALTEARRRSRERGDSAQVWAAWVLVGDAR